jgi:hypothetical protein
MERVRRLWWVGILLPGLAWASGGLGVALASLASFLAVAAFLVWVDRRDADGRVG